jgi:catechol 2,3-dioxygenase-like lactoylglutathione lyase family enzyme
MREFKRVTRGTEQKYDVGGLLLDRPFKIRRLGHFGLYQSDLAQAVHFYVDWLGFRLTDAIPAENGDNPVGYFATHGTDHHAIVLVDRSVGLQRDDRYQRGITVNQMTFQVGSLEEVVKAADYINGRHSKSNRLGRDSPGSNWAYYFIDPDGHTVEIYYGIEQIGWDRRSKPRSMDIRTRAFPALPHRSELSEIEEAESSGIALSTGYRALEPHPRTYDVGGVLLPRPFKVTKIGPVGLFVRDVEAVERFYVEVLGLIRSEVVSYEGHTCVFLRHGTDHHCVGLFPIALRDQLAMSEHTTLMTFGVEVGSFTQLKNAIEFLKAKGGRFVELPPVLHPGIDYAAHVLDPDGHCIQLYYYMEQVGWDGKVRPVSERRKISEPWPDSLDPMSDSYFDQTLPGPLL